MPKRFTDTELWKNQRWFRKLSPIYKLVFCYIKDQCNHAGVWKIDCSDLLDDLGVESIDIHDFVLKVNIEYDKITGNKINKNRLEIVKETSLWVTGFIQFQYQGKNGKVDFKAAPIRTALLVLEGLGTLDEGLRKGYIVLTEPLPEGWQTPKDKEKDKERNTNNKLSQSNGQKKEKAISIDSDTEEAIFKNGKRQPLGQSQKIRFKNDDIKPEEILLNSIH